MKEIQLHRIDLNLLVVFEALMSEGSVAGAAQVLGKTPSAVSHALARLREQLDDPVLVKVGGQMLASPFAVALIEDVRPILRGIRRVLAPPEPFDPATSDRVFRIACPISGRVLSEVMNTLHAAAPKAKLEWLLAPRAVYAAVAEGLVDLAHLAGETRLPDGLEEVEVPSFIWTSFVRAGHPALAHWGPEAWSTYPHVQVAIANDAPSPFDKRSATPAPDRRIGALISEFSSVGPLLANSDMIGTFPRIQMAWDMQRYGLVPLVPQIDLPPFRTRFFWSSRLASDPASVWIRKIVIDTYSALNDEAGRLVEPRLVAAER
ncbi:LysR family transcriptional regulator [Alterinioella nitratireducens]|uniref:LysR family transcriptional regulator n=1 Tax=Alterinioella nitratireducens TaxID=2735915 RepID=UPI001555FFB1|nr:LysR family transcriptional regulator [Alterinioella nitratireducens]NPD19618.1 LysR family transcriptional regulator [Alterinioella nitratireducens]